MVVRSARLLARLLKAHAIGFGRPQRRAIKLGSDLLDTYRIIQLHGGDGHLAAGVKAVPGRLAPIVAAVLREAFLTNPNKAVVQMSGSPAPIDAAEVEDVVAQFVSELGGP